MHKEHYVFTDGEYGKILDNFVIACVDVVVTHKGRILLERRKYDPISGEWWIFGGRMRKGESLHLTAQRSIKRELGLIIVDTERIKQIGVYNLIWPTRREPNTTNGCHHLLIAHQVELTSEEFSKVEALLSQSCKWFDLHNTNEPMLPELRQIIKKLTN